MTLLSTKGNLESPNDSNAPSEIKISTYITQIIIVCIVPLILLASWLVYDNVSDFQYQRDQDAVYQAKNFTNLVDNYISTRIDALQVLSGSPLIDDPSRWNDLYQKALGYRDSFGTNVILAGTSDPAPMLFNTRVDFGEVLPPLPKPEGKAAVPSAIKTGLPAVGDTFHGPIAEQTLVAIAVPVMRDGPPNYVLLTIFGANQFQKLVAGMHLPKGWSLRLIDSTGVIIAKHEPDGFTPLDNTETPNRFIEKSTLSPWSVVIEIPLETYWAPIGLAALVLLFSTVLATGFALFGGIFAGHRLSRSVSSLTVSTATKKPTIDFVEVVHARKLIQDSAHSLSDALDALQENHKKHQLTTELAGIAHWEYDVITGEIGRSDNFNSVFGKELPSDYSLDNFLNTIHLDDREHVNAAIVASVSAGGPDKISFDCRANLPDRELRWLWVSGTVVKRNESGNGILIYGVLMDITSEKDKEAERIQLLKELQTQASVLELRVKQRTAQLEAEKVKAEAADHVKSAFLATMSHELRTPLNSIIGFTGILLQKLPGPINEEQEQQLNIVRRASRHLLELINDVLDISKIEAGELDFALDRLEINEILQRVAPVFATQAGERGLSFKLNLSPTNSYILADRRRVNQILNNLLANALKFTVKGGVSISCLDNGDVVRIAITDTGVGIKMEDINKLFKPFSQVDTSLTTLTEGTGLGLAISKNLVEGMGGQMSVESKWGVGSTFTFTLPIAGDLP